MSDGWVSPPLAGHAGGYLASMKWLLLRSVPRLRLLFRALMLVLITGSVLGRGAEVSAHCARHSPRTANGPGMAMHGGSMALEGASAARTEDHLALHQSSGWSALASSGHQCPHCPPAECATALPCASGSSSQSASGADPAVSGLPVQSLRDLTPAQRATSVGYAPLTPPPQAAA
jgi:hypothetical protein